LSLKSSWGKKQQKLKDQTFGAAPAALNQ